jgi:SAM-dependent methyltransferase
MAKPRSKAEITARRERNSRIARRIGSIVGGPIERRIERRLLERSWVNAKPEMLQKYLVSSYQNPVINVQSIIARHTFIREMDGDQHDALMEEELAWAVEKNRALRKRQQELPLEHGVDFNAIKKSGKWQEAYDEVMSGEEPFAEAWTKALDAAPGAPRISIIEAACGSANDYRFFDSYGLAKRVDYTGIDLTQANIDNCRSMFPGVDFRVGDVQNLPVEDSSYDWGVAHDLLEHLSPSAFNRAIDELCRVTRKGVLISFFMMRDTPEHHITPRRFYHVNELSRRRIEERFARSCTQFEWLEIRPMLAERYGFGDYRGYYNSRAWTMIARH